MNTKDIPREMGTAFADFRVYEDEDSVNYGQGYVVCRLNGKMCCRDVRCFETCRRCVFITLYPKKAMRLIDDLPGGK